MDENDLQQARDLLDLVLGFFQRVEAKLSVVFAVDSAMLAIWATNAPPLPLLDTFSAIASVASLLLIGISLYFWYRASFPQLDGGATSFIYFAEIAKRTEHSYIENYKKQTTEQRLNDVLGQVWRNAEILSSKYTHMKRSMILMAVAVLPWTVALLMFSSLEAESVLLR